MRWFWQKQSSPALERKEAISLNTLLRRLEAVMETTSGVDVTPDNCMESPTIQAIVTAVRNRMVSLPIHVYRETRNEQGRKVKEELPSHPVANLLNRPNEWQTSVDYIGDAVSAYLRWGKFYAVKARGSTGPIRRLLPINPGQAELTQDEQWNTTVKIHLPGGRFQEQALSTIHHVRMPSRDFLNGNSPVSDVREAIALEIAAERFGASFFGNGAVPGLIFKFLESFSGFASEEDKNQFIEKFHEQYSQSGAFKAMVLPAGMDSPEQIKVENDKAQFLETRKLQRNVIAGAFGVPPHLVGDLERGTFSNIEHQSLEFTQAVILPVVRTFEDAMERDLLTDEDRRSGVIIRFNMDGALRGDFKSRQEGLAMQRTHGVINPNEWREVENMNPIPEEDGGESYLMGGPSGQAPSGDQGTEADAEQN